MKGYISKFEKAHRVAKSYGYKEDSFGYKNVVKQIFAKLVVGLNSTIGRVNGKLTITKH
jgi:hypothetical protein